MQTVGMAIAPKQIFPKQRLLITPMLTIQENDFLRYFQWRYTRTASNVGGIESMFLMEPVSLKLEKIIKSYPWSIAKYEPRWTRSIKNLLQNVSRSLSYYCSRFEICRPEIKFFQWIIFSISDLQRWTLSADRSLVSRGTQHFVIIVFLSLIFISE